MVWLFNVKRRFFWIVLSCRYWTDSRWSWRLCWRRELNNNEGEAVQALLYVLTEVLMAENIADSWVSALDPPCSFTVKSYYSLLSKVSFSAENMDANMLKVMRKFITKQGANFSWGLMQDRLATRDNLFKRGILTSPHQRFCVCCFAEPENTQHLFLRCPFSVRVWDQIYCWIGVSFVQYHETVSHFLQHGALKRRKSSRRFEFLPRAATV